MLTIHNYLSCLFFFFNDTATTEIYTLSLHDALPIWGGVRKPQEDLVRADRHREGWSDRKSTRLDSSHTDISRMPSSALKKNKNDLSPRLLRTSPSLSASGSLTTWW